MLLEYIYQCVVTSFSVFVHFLQVYNIIFLEQNLDEHFPRHYDFIIVGGGSAGSIIAERLSSDPNLNVLLIEAGIKSIPLMKIPALNTLQQQTSLDWCYKTVPQKHGCYGLKNQSSLWPAGRVLGGTTHLNYMLYVRGSEDDFTSYSDPDSDSWSWNDILYYFKKSEEAAFSNEFHSSSPGSITVSQTRFSTKLGHAVLRAAAELGYPLKDVNFGETEGFMKPQVNLHRNGIRWTSDDNLIDKQNLKIVTNAVVEKILFKNDKIANAVDVFYHGKKHIFFAAHEIIISAGVIGSPKLLMLSGVGPASHLSSLKIDTVVDLPVGYNLQDHVTTGLDLILLNESTFHVNDLLHINSALQYFLFGTGPYTSAMCEVIGLVKSNNTQLSPDLQLMVMMAGLSSDNGVFMRHIMGISNHVWNNYFESLLDQQVVTILPVLLHPKSRGYIKLASNNPEDPPIIDPNYLSEVEDIQTLIRGIRIIQKLVGTKAMRNLGAKFNDKVFPGCEMYLFDSDLYWQCYIQYLTLTSYHPVGTCKMGQSQAVVDYQLRVYGVHNLRVADASIIPTLPSGNTNAAVVMIAEKAADMIKSTFYSSLSKSPILHLFTDPRQCLIVSSYKTNILRNKSIQSEYNISLLVGSFGAALIGVYIKMMFG